MWCLPQRLLCQSQCIETFEEIRKFRISELPMLVYFGCVCVLSGFDECVYI